MKNLFTLILLISFFTTLTTTIAQSDKKIGIDLSLEMLNGRSWGDVAGLSTKINYPLNNNFSVSGLYFHGSGFGAFGGEPRPEYDDDISTFNEISSLINYNFDDPYIVMYFGAGIGLAWGQRANHENYFMGGLPFVIGSKINISSWFKIGISYIGFVNSEATFTGLGLNLMFII